ncbi:hypothetical protein K440DRAFT_56268 [Wilcoxina mikolae CBS 423.85]|nr:hypothetical protein K440DRAFT_56268 [Wilcoxina mikolae CBS 423.85]
MLFVPDASFLTSTYFPHWVLIWLRSWTGLFGYGLYRATFCRDGCISSRGSNISGWDFMGTSNKDNRTTIDPSISSVRCIYSSMQRTD